MSDLISRQAAITDAHRHIWYRMNSDSMKSYIDEWLNSLPSVEPERRTGKWILQDRNKSNGLVTTCVYYFPVCSECGGAGDFEDKFCKHCGADMRGEQDG